MSKKLIVGIVAALVCAALIITSLSSGKPMEPAQIAGVVLNALVAAIGLSADLPALLGGRSERKSKRARERRETPEKSSADAARPRDSYEFDVFISYCHEDEEWVGETLIPALEEEQLSYCIDEKSFRFGVPTIVNMEHSVMHSRHTVAVLSPAYMASKATAFENMLAQTQDLSGEEPRLIPVMIAECYDLLPPRISFLWICEMRNDRETLGNMPRLMELLKSGVQPKDADADSSKKPAWPPSIYVPPSDDIVPDAFVVRSYESDKVLRALGVIEEEGGEPQGPVGLTAAVQGMGGVGKTVLAAWLLRHEGVRARWPDGVLWATLGPDAIAGGSADPWLLRWGQALKTDLSSYPTTEQRASVLRGLLAERQVLLVVDDVWDVAPARALLGCAGEGCGRLFTTRQLELALSLDADPVRVDVMKPEEALDLLRLRAGEKAMARVTAEQANELCQRLGYHPLAVRLAGAGLWRGASAEEFLQPLREHQGSLELLDLSEAASRLESVTICFDVSVERLSQEDRQRYALLGVLAPEAPFGPQDAAIAWGLEPDDSSIQPTLRTLAHHSLVERVEGRGPPRYRQHALLHEHALGRLDAATRRQAEERHARMYLALVVVYDDQDEWDALDIVHPQAYAALERAYRLCSGGAEHSQEERKAAWELVRDLVCALALNYWQLRALWATARRWNEIALDCSRQLGDRQGEANCIQSLGDVHLRLAEYAEARGRYEEASKIYSEIGARLGEANCIQALGDVHRMLDEYAEARGRYEEALPIHRAIGDRLGEANTHLGLGLAWGGEGDRDAAREHLAAALALYEAMGSPTAKDAREALEKLG